MLSGLDGQQALEVLLERLKKSSTNIEFLMQVQKTTPTPSRQQQRGLISKELVGARQRY